jgi:acyl-CoA thioesterase-1
MPPNLGQAYNAKFMTSFDQVAKQMDVPMVKFFLHGVADVPALMQADGIHPNEHGQPKMLDNVWPVLQPLLTK